MSDIQLTPEQQAKERLKNYVDDILNKNEQLEKILIEFGLIPNRVIQALKELEDIQLLFYNPETRESVIMEKDSKELTQLMCKISYLLGELSPLEVSSITNFSYTNKKLLYLSEFDKAKNNDDEFKKVYALELENLTNKELKAIGSNPKNKEIPKEELEDMAKKIAKEKLEKLDIRKSIKSVTDKEAESKSYRSTIYAMKVFDFLDAYNRNLLYKQQLAKKLFDTTKDMIISNNITQSGYKNIA